MRGKFKINEYDYDNASVDKKVGFIEDTHTYIMVDNPELKFNSVTTLLKEYKEPFDSEAIAKKNVKKKGSPYYGRDWEEVVREWEEKGRKASEEGTRLHEYGEDLLNSVEGVEPPDLIKSKWVPEAVNKLWSEGYELARTELLVYSEMLKIAGQSDIILKKKFQDNYSYMIYDWKFLGKPIAKKSYYNPIKRTYKKMSGPFKHLMDCNWIHYSIQLSIYQTLSGDPSRITEKVLVVVYDDGYEFVPAYPMRVFWDEEHRLQAIYEIWTGQFYDSRYDELVNEWPEDIKGR